MSQTRLEAAMARARNSKSDFYWVAIPVLLAALFVNGIAMNDGMTTGQQVLISLTVPWILTVVVLSALPSTRLVLWQAFHSEIAISFCQSIRYLGSVVILLSFIALSTQLLRPVPDVTSEQFYAGLWALSLGLLMRKCPCGEWTPEA